ncbi:MULTISPECIES: hypothetical protein [unclassified Roseofilum]|uniref:hypothetical protein n=1 Tax=unclassified Roseofilum TaxID=2620099 RepID=UPI000E7EFA6A|nr:MULTISPECIES: hypothetical protein [unclassified Roseofilum]HBR00163.1 hypothetical protein [Cyanobacteria bacterium UBA11691]MBP0007520.1 hypothetical protein [Roseofilum sp. Belize Diploria]MBP0012806.1 hypothetical protein [Roseofilum sp. SID3]MBP0025184.1 hypothetical protein [Roseofilum sp. SID2]MBP0031798.1 hypothetical protein [Roseofilum sp. Belize BBD 4]
MLTRLKTLSCLGLLASLGVFTLASKANAQFNADPNPVLPNQAVVYQSIPELFDAAYYSNGGDYFYQRSFVGQVQNFLGLPRFSEHNTRRSAQLVHILYKNISQVQNTSTPIVRTQDLYNPFDQNLVVSPSVSIESNPIPPAPTPFVPFSAPPVAPLPPAPPPPAPEPQLF